MVEINPEAEDGAHHSALRMTLNRTDPILIVIDGYGEISGRFALSIFPE